MAGMSESMMQDQGNEHPDDERRLVGLRELIGRTGRVDRVRAYEPELTLIGERALTLPPTTHPWDRFDRRRQLRRREQYLGAVRRERRRARCWRFLRPVLTLGVRR